jgi:hypothetical protein
MQLAPNTTRLFALLFGAALLCALSLAALSVPSARAADAVATAIKAPEIKASISARCRAQVLEATSGRKASTRAAARRLRHARSVRQRRCSKRLHSAAARRRQAPKASQSSATPQIGPLVIGVDGGYGSWSASEVEERVALNAAVTRHEWDPSEPVDAQDSLVYEAASEVHTRIHALLGANELGDPNHYREWVVEFIRRYGIGGSFWRENPGLDSARYAITTFELGNEPYFGGMTPTAYATTVKPTLEEVARLGLPAKIILPSRVYGNDTSWMDTLYRTIPDLNNLFYGFADHPYWYGHDPAQVSAAGPFGRITTLRNRMNELGAGAKPIFISEYGESTANCGGECVDEATQAKHLTEMIEAVTTHTEWGVEMLSVFQLVDRGTQSSDRELQFGLLRQDGTPKPSYAIVDAAMQQHRG